MAAAPKCNPTRRVASSYTQEELIAIFGKVSYSLTSVLYIWWVPFLFFIFILTILANLEDFIFILLHYVLYNAFKISRIVPSIVKSCQSF